MFQRIQALIFPVLNRRRHFTDDELYRYVLMLAVAIVACSVHVLFSFYFLLILRGASRENAGHVLDNLRRAVAERPFLIKGQAVPITLTIGLDTLDPTHIQRSLKNCDKLMYQGKRAGKNRVVM